MRALIVDDDPAMRGLLETVAEAAGLDVSACASGEEAWARYISEPYGLVLLDWILPGMDGVELCRRMRAVPQSEKTVILIVTARRGPADLQAVLEAGADDYIAKPVDPEVLRVRITVAVRTAQNMIARARAEARLRDTERRLGTILGALPVTLFSLDDKCVCTVSRGSVLRDVLGLESEPTGADFRALLRGHARATHALEAALAGVGGECQLEVGDRVVELRFAPTIDEHDRRVVNGLATDTTERVQMQRALEESLQRVRKADAQILDLRRLLDERSTFHELIGRTREMQAVYDQVRDFAAVDWTVLVQGETGTGKELVARAIHNESPRRGRPFVAVNCAGLSVSLLQSQLFGHRRGAFTGATADHIGYFEAADGGTLFLDEIGDIAPEVQMALLRVLEEGEITRVGESQPRKVDVRVITATHRDLSREVERGRFRPDLMYRIRVARIQLPPLRERRPDIPLLVERFVERACAATGKHIHGVTDGAMATLLEHPWPGNVRELRSAIEFAVVRTRGAAIDRDDLPRELAAAPTRDVPVGGDEIGRIRAALERAGGNRTRAAKLLGISRATFYRRISELGIDL